MYIHILKLQFLSHQLIYLLLYWNCGQTLTPLVLSTKYYSSCVAEWQAVYIKKTGQNTAQALICLYAASQLVTGVNL